MFAVENGELKGIASVSGAAIVLSLIILNVFRTISFSGSFNSFGTQLPKNEVENGNFNANRRWL